MPEVTPARLRSVLNYDLETGVWTWQSTLSARRVAGSAAGTTNDQGYRIISVDGRDYRAHRLAWLYVTGAWPTEQIDHINGIRGDNRWCNLRAATEQQNKANTRVSKSSRSGVKGVFWSERRRKWFAKINPDRKQVHLGYFDRIEDAAAAYAAGARRFYGEFAKS